VAKPAAATMGLFMNCCPLRTAQAADAADAKADYACADITDG